jgi:predicted ATPase
MIRTLRLENFKGHRDTELTLEPFTMLVGDNGSGKTSVLEALRLPELLRVAPSQVALEELVRDGALQLRLSFAGTTYSEPWNGKLSFTAFERRTLLSAIGRDAYDRFDVGATSDEPASYPSALQRLVDLVGRPRLYRFRSDEIAATSYSTHPGGVVDERGAETAVVLASLKLSDDETFNKIEDALRVLVPSLSRVRIRPSELTHSSNPNPVVGSKLYFDFRSAKGVPAHHASQGTLVALALLTVLLGPDRPNTILLDDFDHSLHPRAQMELVRMLKQLLAQDEFRDTQIVATTHSPYVLDEMSPSSVIAFALRDDGSVAAKPLSEHPDAPKVSGALKTGELWSLDAERDWVL